MKYRQINYVSIKCFKNYYPKGNIENILENFSKCKKSKSQKSRKSTIIFFEIKMKIKNLIRQINFSKKTRLDIKNKYVEKYQTKKISTNTNFANKQSFFKKRIKSNEN